MRKGLPDMCQFVKRKIYLDQFCGTKKSLSFFGIRGAPSPAGAKCLESFFQESYKYQFLDLSWSLLAPIQLSRGSR